MHPFTVTVRPLYCTMNGKHGIYDDESMYGPTRPLAEALWSSLCAGSVNGTG